VVVSRLSDVRLPAAWSALALALLTACGPTQASETSASPSPESSCGSGAGFSLSLATPAGGAVSPTAAAEAVSGKVPGWSIPATGWSVVPGGSPAATYLRSGNLQVTAVQVSDGTWFVTEGTRCG
jgi:hypothetical protein